MVCIYSFDCDHIQTMFLQLVLFVCALHSATASTEKCEIGESVRVNSFHCCDGERFILGQDLLVNDGSCDFEPKDKTLRFNETKWLLYSCMVKHCLGSTPLTKETYFKFMSQNLSESKQDAINQYLSEEGQFPLPYPKGEKLSEDKEEIQKIVNYWNLYFKAEFKVCKVLSNTKSSTRLKLNDDDIWKLWLPVSSCVNGSFPKVLEGNNALGRHHKWNVTAYRTCRVEGYAQFKNLTSKLGFPFGYMWPFCLYLSHDEVSKSDLEGLSSWQAYIEARLPTHYSEFVRNLALAEVEDKLKRHVVLFSADGKTSSSDLLSQLLKIFDANVAKFTAETGHVVTNLEYYRNAYIVYNLQKELKNAFDFLCSGV